MDNCYKLMKKTTVELYSWPCSLWTAHLMCNLIHLHKPYFLFYICIYYFRHKNKDNIWDELPIKGLMYGNIKWFEEVWENKWK